MQNSSDPSFTNITENAIDEWQNSFEKISYDVYTIPPDDYDISINIFKTDEDTGAVPRLSFGFAMYDVNRDNSELIQSQITLPTYYRDDYGATERNNDVTFYNLALHEFGHALGLGHAADNGLDPLDPMYHYMYLDERPRKVSKLDLIMLESLYK